jgi:hypothetical protein
MTTEEALRFLTDHQPMPRTEDAPEELLRQLDAVLTHFEVHRDPRCIPLLLNLFGEGDGYGVYQLVESVLLVYPEQLVVPHLINSLRDSRPWVRYWSADIAANYQNKDLIDPLIDIAISDDDTLRALAIFALGRYPAITMVPLLGSVRHRAISQRARRDLDDLISRLFASTKPTDALHHSDGLGE